MKNLKFFVWLVICLPFNLFSIYLSFEKIGEYEENAVYTDIKVLGRYAFLVAGNKGVHIFDISNPYHINKVAEIESVDYSYAIDLKGFDLYIADGIGGVRIFDVRNKRDPKQITFIPTSHKSVDLKVSADYCFVADDEGGFRIINISRPVFPEEISIWDESEKVRLIEVVDDYVYLTDEKGILALRFASPDSLENYRRLVEAESIKDIFSDDRLLFISSDSRGLLIVDISNISNPLIRELPNKYSGIGDFYLSGFYLYTVQDNIIWALNILTPFNPSPEGKMALSVDVSAVCVSGNLLYAACGFNGFQIFKITE